GTNFPSSINYTLNEYASDVVYRVASVCNARDIPHPMIVSESGRAVAAYHSVLIFDALGSSALDKFRVTGDRAEDYGGEEELPQQLEDLESIPSDPSFCNFSVFQPPPDSWAIDQLFPILPIHRLDERPTRTAVLADITCDSDGKIDHFVSLRDVKRTLELHELRGEEKYYLAAFLVGAYQETLGDLHNLFGDTHVVHVRLHDEGGWWIEEIVK